MLKTSEKTLAVAFTVLANFIFFYLPAIAQREVRTDTMKVDASDTATQQAGSLLNQSVIAIRQNKWQEARSLLEAADKLGPNKLSKDVEGNLAVVLEHFGLFDLALTCLKKEYALAPTDANVLEQFAAYHQQLGEYPQAVTYLDQYLKLYPNAHDAASIAKIVDNLRGRSATSSVKGSSEDYFAETTRVNFCRFHTPRDPLKVFIESGTDVNGYKKQYRDFLVKAFDAWTSASKALTWSIVDDKSNADIVCMWSDKPDTISGGKYAESGEARSKYLKHEIASSEVTILTVPLAGVDLNDDSINAACLHEVGHALGLINHSPNHSDVMFGDQTEQPRVELSTRDKATIARLYASDLPTGTNP